MKEAENRLVWTIWAQRFYYFLFPAEIINCEEGMRLNLICWLDWLSPSSSSVIVTRVFSEHDSSVIYSFLSRKSPHRMSSRVRKTCVKVRVRLLPAPAGTRCRGWWCRFQPRWGGSPWWQCWRPSLLLLLLLILLRLRLKRTQTSRGLNREEPTGKTGIPISRHTRAVRTHARPGSAQVWRFLPTEGPETVRWRVSGRQTYQCLTSEFQRRHGNLKRVCFHSQQQTGNVSVTTPTDENK